MLAATTSITDRRSGRLSLFGLLYFVQGALFAYVLVFNNLYLRAFNASAQQLAWLNGLLVIPFILKIGIGLLSDKVSLFGRGHRLPYMISGLCITAGSLCLAAFIPPVTYFPLFLAVSLLIALGVALYDTVTDGLAVDVTPPEEMGLVQGSMVIGRSLGLVMLAAAYGRVITEFGWGVVFVAATFFSLTPLLLLWRVREPEERPPTRTFDWNALRALWQPRVRLLMVFGILYSFVAYGANAIVALFANEGLGASLVQVGDAAALGGLGMLIGGGIVMALDRKFTIWTRGVGVTVLISLTLLGIALFTSLENVLTMTLVWGMCLAAVELIFVTLAMLNADPRLGAATFAIFMAIGNVGTGLGQATTTGLIDTIDFRWLFALLGVMNLTLLPLLYRLRRLESAPTPS
ncbi:MAG: MFS transporter [Anaerolineales bacterium]|nr:MFS transporter [Anaerolineales bacterium]MCB8951026.1 MFS transporter [Ardenticatenales bacterium]